MRAFLRQYLTGRQTLVLVLILLVLPFWVINYEEWLKARELDQLLIETDEAVSDPSLIGTIVSALSSIADFLNSDYVVGAVLAAAAYVFLSLLGSLWSGSPRPSASPKRSESAPNVLADPIRCSIRDYLIGKAPRATIDVSVENFGGGQAVKVRLMLQLIMEQRGTKGSVMQFQGFEDRALPAGPNATPLKHTFDVTGSINRTPGLAENFRRSLILPIVQPCVTYEDLSGTGDKDQRSWRAMPPGGQELRREPREGDSDV